MLGIYLAIIIYCLYKKIEIPKLIYVYLMIMILSLIYTAICPGNINRYNKTIRTVFPEYATFNLINKLDIGTTLFLNWTTTRCDIITIIFFGIMGIYGYIISQKRKIALLTFIPIIIVLAFLDYEIYWSCFNSAFCSSRWVCLWIIKFRFINYTSLPYFIWTYDNVCFNFPLFSL